MEDALPIYAAAATALTPKSGLEITADIDESRFDCDGRGRGKTHTVRAHSPGHWILTTSTRSSGGQTRNVTSPSPSWPKCSVRWGCEFLLRGPVQLPLVHASDAELGADLLPGHALPRRRQPVGAVAVHARQELPLGAGVAPGVCLEPPAPYRLHLAAPGPRARGPAR